MAAAPARAVTRLPVGEKPGTASEVEPLTVPTLAWIVVRPAATPVANPELLIVATVVAEEVHVAVEVRFCVLLSEYVPVAVNCWLPPELTEAFAGVTAMETSVVTVKLAPLLVTPDTVTTTLPVVAPEGTGTTMLVPPQLVGVAVVPLNLIVLLP